MNKKGLITIIVLLVTLLCGTTTYIVYDKMNPKSVSSSNSKKCENEKIKKEQTTIYLEEKDVSSFMKNY